MQSKAAKLACRVNTAHLNGVDDGMTSPGRSVLSLLVTQFVLDHQCDTFALNHCSFNCSSYAVKLSQVFYSKLSSLAATKKKQKTEDIHVIMDRWLGKTAAVTGAASGMGKAITLALLRNRVNVVALDIEKEGLAKLDEECKKDHTLAKLYSIHCDVSVENEIDKAFSTIETLGGVDIMVNCAGVCYYTRIIDSERKTFEKLLDINVLTYAVCMNKAVKSMRQRNVEGHIFNINSILAHNIPTKGLSENDDITSFNIYPATKHASRVLTTLVRREIAAVQAPIRVTSISPGAVRTNITKHTKELADFFDKERCIEPEDVANALIYVLGTRSEVQITELTIQPTLEEM